MTILEKAVRRQLADRDLVVEMTREGIRTREKGRRTWYGPFPWGKLHLTLARMTADQRVAERKAERRARRGAR